ncbi:MAG: hypothetical protein C4519_05470 [Desulfobacteraceae bacterium]|nr:MAG: hypothetical protein C4519_05470 [Desulfobacteraceae bacterium]
MANQFLVEIHDYISRRIDEDRCLLAAAQAAGHDGRITHLTGRLDQWGEIRTFLSSHFDLVTVKYY